MNIIFGVINTNQLQTALNVISRLEEFSGKVLFLNLTNMELTSEPPVFDSHTPKHSVSRFLLALMVIPKLAGNLLVLGQDVGFFERLIATQLTKIRGDVVIIPDGVFHAGSPVVKKSKLFKSAAFSVFRLIGLIRGRQYVWFESKPTQVHLWGLGWKQQNLKSEQVITGSPRFDTLSSISAPLENSPSRVLICSTSLESFLSSDELNNWYYFLSKAVKFQNTRVRLHPNESPQIPINYGHHLSVERTTTFHEDLRWATHVVSPFSTTLVEAIAAGRKPVIMRLNESVDKFLEQIPVFKHGVIPRILFDKYVSEEEFKLEVLSVDIDIKLLSQYLSNVGFAADNSAKQLLRLVNG